MKCQICQVNDANIVFTQIVNNEKVVLHICTECAGTKGLTVEIGKGMKPLPEPLLNAVKSAKKAVMKKAAAEPAEVIPDITCDSCGLTYAEFKSSGLFGCEHCHLAFGEHVRALLVQIHGASMHEGRTPSTEISKEIQDRQRLKKLRTELSRSVEVEDYERAAQLRDQIELIEREAKGT